MTDEMKSSGSSLLAALVVFVVGLLIAGLSVIAVDASNQRVAEERFSQLSQRVVQQVLARFHVYQYGLRGARGAVIAATPERITRERFRVYSESRDQDSEFPGSRGYGFIRKVPPEQAEAFERAARQDGSPNFHIKQLEKHSGDLFVIQYIEPEARNWQAIGLDIASETHRRLAALAAVRENVAVITKPITLVQANGRSGSGFLLLMPVFASGAAPKTPEERWRDLAGWAYTPLVVDEVLETFDFQHGQFELALSDMDYANTATRFYRSGPPSDQRNLPVRAVTGEIFGRQWLIEVHATPKFVDALNLPEPWRVGALAVFISTLLSGLLYVYRLYRQRHFQSLTEKRRLAAIVESSNDAIIGISLQGVVTSWNKAAERLLGYPAEGAVGRTTRELIVPPELQPEEARILERVARGDVVPHFQTRRQRKDGSMIDVSVTVSPIRSARGEAVGAAKTLRDISEQVAYETRILDLNASLERQVEVRTEELNHLRLAAEAANQAKSEFLANMSHEIRSPLNAVLGLTYLLEQQRLPSESQGMISKIRSSGQALLDVINDILDFSKIEAGHLSLEHIPFRLNDVLDKLAAILAVSQGDKQIEVVVEPAPAGAEYLCGDAVRLGQVLINLASNALKFTFTGEVVVFVRRLDAGDVPGRVRLRFGVQDSGIGIAADKQERIFESFAQADTSTTRNFGGTGLGLTISRRLVEMMGGKLMLESEEGVGSTFSFELELETPTADASTQGTMTYQRLLIADDHEIALGTLAAMVQSLGWSADTVGSGQAVLNVCAEDKHYDVLLLDWRMPGVDGLETAKCLRAGSNDTDSPIIIMVTAHDRGRLEGEVPPHTIDAILTKPVTSSMLLNAVLEAKHMRCTLTGAPERTHHRLDGLRLLVVDDSEVNREVARDILEGEGAEVAVADNGANAVRLLALADELPDVVLMDVQMPVLDGYEATRRIRSDPRLAHLPVVALTAGAFRSQQQAALDAGMDDFVGKPFDVDALMHVILRHSKRKRTPVAPLYEARERDR